MLSRHIRQGTAVLTRTKSVSVACLASGKYWQRTEYAYDAQKSSWKSFASIAGAVTVAGGFASGSGIALAEEVKVKTKEPLSFERIAKLPRPGVQAIGKPTWSPDGSHILYLKSTEYGSLSRQLYVTEVATGKTWSLACTPPGTGEEENLSLEEKLRRERAREMNTGVTDFKVVGEGANVSILIPMGGVLYMREGLAADGAMKKVVDPQAAPLGSGPLLDPSISKDGSTIAFVWKNELYCAPADGSSEPWALTTGARDTGKTHGLADFLAQEELDRYEGYWLSADGKQVIYEQVDESHIDKFRIMHSGSESVGDGAQEDHHYPFAGAKNPKVRLFVAPTAKCSQPPTPKEIDLTGPFGEDFYLARLQWMPDGTAICQVLNREQSQLAVVSLNPKDGSTKVLFVEKTDLWINVHNMLKPIGETGKFLWANESTGFRQLYIYEPGTGLKALTKGSFVVESVEAIDEKNGVVYFSGTSETDVLGRQLYAVSLTGGKIHRVTSEPGTHSTVVNTESNTFVDIYNSAGSPSVATLRSLKDGSKRAVIFKNQDPALEELALTPPDFVSFPSADGQVTLQAATYRPDPSKFGPGPYPTVVSCYGGPHVQFVGNHWGMTVDLRAQALRDRGYLVLKVDNRGSYRRGHAFEGAIKHNCGTLEVDDQVAGVKWAVAQGLADEARVGIFGWSYGGYLSAMCLVKAPDVFKCAVSGAPVTHWDGYDTCYTERYMGTPQSNPKGYKESAVMAHVNNLKGDLLLVHGLIDENVHFRHTARLINALIAAQKPYELLIFPNERHSPRSQKDREYMEQRMTAFLAKSLK